MPFLHFLRDNARWVAGGFLLTFFSSFGQTFFISLSAGEIRAEYDLSHGGFGTLYMLATLASAATLPQLGKIVDRISVASTVLLAAPVLAVACILMAWSRSLMLLLLAVYLLRLFGQGMFTHIAMTAMGRWFAAQRGRAISLTAIGVNLGEAVFPVSFVGVAALLWLARIMAVGGGRAAAGGAAGDLSACSRSSGRRNRWRHPDRPAAARLDAGRSHPRSRCSGRRCRAFWRPLSSARRSSFTRSICRNCAAGGRACSRPRLRSCRR
jgi:MFS family permease